MPRAIPRKAKNIHVLEEKKKGKKVPGGSSGNNKRLRIGPFSGSDAFGSLGKEEEKSRNIYMYIEELTTLGLET